MVTLVERDPERRGLAAPRVGHARSELDRMARRDPPLDVVEPSLAASEVEGLQPFRVGRRHWSPPVYARGGIGSGVDEALHRLWGCATRAGWYQRTSFSGHFGVGGDTNDLDGVG